MSNFYRFASTVVLSALTLYGQADQVVDAEKRATSAAQQSKDAKKPEKPETSLADLMGPHFDSAAVERGRKIFVPTCGFCHGNDAHGKSGPDLVRSAVVLHDNNGDTLGPVVRNGRPDRGMPAFSSFSAGQIADISTFLHSRAADAANRFAYKLGDLITGDSQKGSAFFKGAGHCDTCHSPAGDLAHVASKYEPAELQRRMLYPAPNMIDMYLGRAVKPPAPTKVTVHLSSGEQVSGVLDHMDEFTVSLHDSNGWYRSFSRDNATVEVHDPREAHAALLPKYTDDDMHNVLAYLETFK